MFKSRFKSIIKVLKQDKISCFIYIKDNCISFIYKIKYYDLYIKLEKILYDKYVIV